MAPTLPLNIPIPQSAAIASFNYTDIAEGTGVVLFYGATHKEVSTTSYFLTTNTPYSNDVITSGAILQSANWTEVINKNFDVRFNRPQNIKGYAYLSLSLGGYASAGAGSLQIKVSGATLNN